MIDTLSFGGFILIVIAAVVSASVANIITHFVIKFWDRPDDQNNYYSLIIATILSILFIAVLVRQLSVILTET